MSWSARAKLLAVTLPISVVLEVYVRYIAKWQFGTDFFAVWGPIDNVMHFLWGLNIALMLMVWTRWSGRDAVLGVFAFQWLWEALEIGGDIFLSQPVHMLDHFWWDGLKDTGVDVLGALTAIGLLVLLPGGLDGLRETRHRRWLERFSLAMVPMIVVGGFWWYARSEPGRSPSLFALVWVCLMLLVVTAQEWRMRRGEALANAKAGTADSRPSSADAPASPASARGRGARPKRVVKKPVRRPTRR